MPKKDKTRSINVSMKWKHWNIKSWRKTSILLLYCDFFSYCQLIPLSVICFLGISRVKPKLLHYILGTLTDHSLSGPPKYHSLLASHPIEPHTTDQRSLDLQKPLNLNIYYYFINTLASTHDNTWQHRGGPITQKIDHFGLNPNHWRSVEGI